MKEDFPYYVLAGGIAIGLVVSSTVVGVTWHFLTTSPKREPSRSHQGLLGDNYRKYSIA
jgi:hypothetical protein